MANNAIWGPDGVTILGGPKPTRVELRSGVGEWLAQFEMVAQTLKLGLHCALCGTDLVGKNSESAKTYAAVCQCREFVFQNRDYTPPTEFNFYER